MAMSATWEWQAKCRRCHPWKNLCGRPWLL